jgi:outer membrane protein
MLNRLIVVLVVAFGGFANAQTQPATPSFSGICFVTAQKILQNHPQGPVILEAQKKAQEELNALAAQIQALQVKVANGSATATDRQQLETLIKTYQARGQQLKRNVDKLLEPVTAQVDAAIAQVAQAKGCVLVFDRAIASSSGLVVYANPLSVLDISDDVIACCKRNDAVAPCLIRQNES